MELSSSDYIGRNITLFDLFSFYTFTFGYLYPQNSDIKNLESLSPIREMADRKFLGACNFRTVDQFRSEQL